MATNPAHLATDCIHGGQHADPTTGAVMPPIYTSSTFIQESPGVHKGYEYSRSHNATRFAFERCLATLERSGLGEDAERTCGGFAFASGLAAIATALELMDAGDTIVCMDDVYGGTNRLLNRVRKRSAGYKVVHVDLSDLKKAEAAIREHRPRMVWLETPTNPTLKLVDIEAVCRLARAAGAVSVVDNTFATPMLTRPIELGADIVMHSTTKYVGGHSDTVGGGAVTNNPELAEKIGMLQNAMGSGQAPFDCFLVLRGIKTLPVRMDVHNANALALAKWLQTRPEIKEVLHPGLESHPQHELAKRQMSGYGGTFSFRMQNGEMVKKALSNVKMFTLAESLGGVESLIEQPWTMTHVSMPEDVRVAVGITDDLVRVSVGIEHIDDIIADLQQAFEA